MGDGEDEDEDDEDLPEGLCPLALLIHQVTIPISYCLVGRSVNHQFLPKIVPRTSQ